GRHPAGESKSFAEEGAVHHLDLGAFFYAQDLPRNPRIIRDDLERLKAPPQSGERLAQVGRQELLGEESSAGAENVDRQIPFELLTEEVCRVGRQSEGAERTLLQVEFRIAGGEAEIE